MASASVSIASTTPKADQCSFHYSAKNASGLGAVVLAAVSDLFQHTASSTVRKNAVRSAGRARLFKYLNGVDETGIG